jgi:hypothetical protein
VVDGNRYVAHMANVHYWIGQNNITAMEHAIVDCGANVGICGYSGPGRKCNLLMSVVLQDIW